MNPFRENSEAIPVVEAFYHKYYNDHNTRHLILGINPGRFGAGATGIPFTDPKRLLSECGITYNGRISHEPSSVFVYEMINEYGGPELFYKNFFINSPCPLGFTSTGANGKETNYNYYDNPQLIDAVEDYIISHIHKLLTLGIYTDKCFCFGTGKNYAYLQRLNNQHNFFKSLVPLEHPRFIMQYKNKSKPEYIAKYISAFRTVTNVTA